MSVGRRDRARVGTAVAGVVAGVRTLASSELGRAFRSALWIALVPGGLLFAFMQIRGYAHLGMISVDAHAYWVAARDPSSWYTRAPATWDAYLYSPAFAQALWPLGQLPWRAFQLIWLAGQLGALAWMLAPLGWRRAAVVTLFVVPELVLGNIYLFLAAALVLMVRGSAGSVAFFALTKVFPGVVALWLVMRRDWRAVWWAAAWTVGIVAVSAAVAPHAWVSWLHFLTTSAQTGRGFGAIARLAVAVLLSVWAALRGHAVALAPALVLACPLLGAYSALTVLVAIPRLVRLDRARRSARAATQAAAEAEAHPATAPDPRRQPELARQT